MKPYPCELAFAIIYHNTYYYSPSFCSGAKVGSCFLSNTCLGLGVEVLARLEQRQEGLTWGNVASPISIDDNFNMAWVFGMLIIDSILYMIVAWWVWSVGVVCQIVTNSLFL